MHTEKRHTNWAQSQAHSEHDFEMCKLLDKWISSFYFSLCICIIRVWLPRTMHALVPVVVQSSHQHHNYNALLNESNEKLFIHFFFFRFQYLHRKHMTHLKHIFQFGNHQIINGTGTATLWKVNWICYFIETLVQEHVFFSLKSKKNAEKLLIL